MAQLLAVGGGGWRWWWVAGGGLWAMGRGVVAVVAGVGGP